MSKILAEKVVAAEEAAAVVEQVHEPVLVPKEEAALVQEEVEMAVVVTQGEAATVVAVVQKSRPAKGLRRTSAVAHRRDEAHPTTPRRPSRKARAPEPTIAAVLLRSSVPKGSIFIS